MVPPTEEFAINLIFQKVGTSKILHGRIIKYLSEKFTYRLIR